MPVDPRLAALEDLVDEDSHEDTPETPEVETQAPVEDTPAAPEVPSVDWEKRYGDLRSEFDRRAQREAEREEQLRQYEEQLAAMQSQPTAPSHDVDEDDYYEDPLQDPRLLAQLQRVDRLEAQLAQRAQQETLAQEHARKSEHINGYLDQVEKQLGYELSDTVSNWIGREALANPDPVTGLPDVEKAYADFVRETEAVKARWVDTKRSDAPASGPGAVEVPDLDDPEQLEEYLDRAFQAGNPFG